ncbi:protein of unknown function [Methylotuvimicrobium alcaliphilum 20Z]|uniref:Uncharacterized protein n=1 Tax=Methylotuvimicrobium alcaliphilum (strain DSM 19304 / NCIMB 14124 / VKM B-2133 / 20Z) TaxID=1091494 RepID=G4T1K4_META2|nr:protein of unknown function [Methylotuvimicrobium alcaliphilum 20Z]
MAQNKLDVDDRARQIVMENFTVANTAQSIIDVLSLGV